MNIVLVFIGIILVVSVIVGYQKGFLKLALSLGVTLAGIMIVFAISPHVSAWIQQSTPLVESVQKKVGGMLFPEGESEEEHQVVEMSREQQISVIEKGDIPEFLQDRLLSNNNKEVYETLGVTTFAEYIVTYIAKILADIIAFLVTLIAVLIIIRVLMGMAGILNKVPVVGGINKLAGGIAGVGVGIVIVWIMFIVVTMLYNTTIGKMCLENIAADPTLTKLYNSNILMNNIVKF